MDIIIIKRELFFFKIDDLINKKVLLKKCFEFTPELPFPFPAASSLVFTSAQSLEVDRPNDALLLTTTTGVKGQHSNNSLVHCLIKLLQKTNQNAVLRAGFSLMCTLALSQECRGVLWKVGALVLRGKEMRRKTRKCNKKQDKNTGRKVRDCYAIISKVYMFC